MASRFWRLVGLVVATLAMAGPASANWTPHAQQIAVEHWGVNPCNGEVAIFAKDLGETTLAQAGYSSINDLSIPTNCSVTYNSAMKDWTWPRFCTVTTHEYGHLLGYGHSDNEWNVMYPYYVHPIAECRGQP